MKKIKYIIEETVRYKHEITVDGKAETLDQVLDHLDDCDNLDDLAEAFRQAGCTVCDVDEDDDGESEELEYFDEINVTQNGETGGKDDITQD